MKYLLFLAIVAFVIWLVRAQRPATRRRRRPDLLDDDDAVFSVPAEASVAFDRCAEALARSEAEVRTADPARGLFTAAYPTRHQRERFLVIIQIEELDGDGLAGAEVSLSYKAESFTPEHPQFVRETLREIARYVRAGM